jgi:hypothetical protein
MKMRKNTKLPKINKNTNNKQKTRIEKKQNQLIGRRVKEKDWEG